MARHTSQVIMDEGEEDVPVPSIALIAYLEKVFRRPAPERATSVDHATFITHLQAAQAGREEVIAVLKSLNQKVN